MPRYNLTVPYPQRADAKALGARWDALAKTWYVPDGLNAEPFARWTPVMNGPDVRAPAYYIARSARQCWKCERETVVHGFALTPPYEFFGIADEDYDNDEAENKWITGETSAWLSYVSGVSESVLTWVKAFTPFLYYDTSKMANSRYLMNHCEHCSSKLGDFDTVQEFNAPLNPIYLASIARVTLFDVSEPFEASATLHHNIEVDAVSLARKMPATERGNY